MRKFSHLNLRKSRNFERALEKIRHVLSRGQQRAAWPGPRIFSPDWDGPFKGQPDPPEKLQSQPCPIIINFSLLFLRG